MADTYLNQKGAEHRVSKIKTWADGSFVRYTTKNQVSVAGNGKNVSSVTPNTLFVSNGLIMGGTALSAGLVTRGICGVRTPNADGSCTKEHLYINYDGDNNYNRKLVLGAGGVGDPIPNSLGAYTYSAVRGDQRVAYVTGYVPGAIQTWYNANAPKTKTLNTNNSSALAVSASEALTGSGSVSLHRVSKTGRFGDLSNRGEAFLEWGGKNFAGSYGPIDSAMIPDLGANRIAFRNPAGISIEYSTDSGTTWQDYGATNNQKLQLTTTGGSFYIGNKGSSTSTEKDRLRISLHSKDGGVYTALNKFAIYISTNGCGGTYCTIRGRTQNNYLNKVDTWTTFADKQSILGLSGWNIINTSGITTYGNTPASQYGEIQLIFGCTSGTTNASWHGLQIQKLYAYGGVGWQTPSNLAKYGTIYSYTYDQGVTFPSYIVTNGGITAKQLIYAEKGIDVTGGNVSVETGNVTISKGTINVNQYNDAGGTSLRNTAGNATQIGSSGRPIRLYSNAQPEWYQLGQSKGVLALKSDLKTKYKDVYYTYSGQSTDTVNFLQYNDDDYSISIGGTTQKLSLSLDPTKHEEEKEIY